MKMRLKWDMNMKCINEILKSKIEMRFKNKLYKWDIEMKCKIKFEMEMIRNEYNNN